MITRSPELEAITKRWIDALARSDGEMMLNLLASEDPLLFCGSAPNEVYRNDALRDGYGRHIAEMPGARWINQIFEAWQTGDSGWCFFTGTLHTDSTGKESIARVTLVYTLEKGIWKVQHIHNSFAVSNIEAMGYEHTAFDDLLDAAAKADPQIGKTGIAAVMFTDIADSSVLAALVGDTAWTKRVSSHMKMLEDHIRQNEGRLIKSLGDGTMSTFSSARSAMTTAQSIQRALADDRQEPSLPVRIGIHTGDVVQAGDDFFGSVVNKAARVASVTGSGEIRVSDATRIMVGATQDFAFDDPAKVPLKGLDGEHLIHRLIW